MNSHAGNKKMNKNLNTIKNFIMGKDETLLINQVSNEIAEFYEYAIKLFSKKISLKVVNKAIYDKENYTNDLFENKKIYIYFSTNTKQIGEISNKKFQKIIFTDYKNYKKFKNIYLTINGYEFDSDLRSLLIDNFKIDDEILLNYCLEQPYLINSEITKYNINKTEYSVDPYLNNTKNFILDIRKDIYKIKSSQTDIKTLFLKIKNETKYKKFNFLTF